MNWNDFTSSRKAFARLNTRPPDGILQEFNNVKHLIVKHRSTYGSGWCSLTIHGEKPHWTEAINRYPGYSNIQDWNYNYHWTEVADQCPITVKYIKSLPFKKFARVRFMLLKAGGLIDYHRDVDYMNLYPLNISINNPLDCEFNIYDQNSSNPVKTIPFIDNSAFIVNIGLYHRVINRSQEDRLHIIVHGHYTDEFELNYEKFLIDQDND